MSYAKFAEVVDTASAATSKVDRHAPVIAFLKNSELMASMEMTALEDPTGVESLVIELSSLPGMSGIAARVRALFRTGADNARQRMREKFRTAEEDEERPALDLGEGAEHLPPIIIPERYVVSRGGVQEKKKTPDGIALVRVNHRPILPTRILADIDTGERSLQIEWPARRCWDSRILPAATVQDPKAFVACMQAAGAPVAAHNGKTIARFLDDVLEHNTETIPRAWKTSRMGWMRGGELGFALGREIIGSKHVRVELPQDGSEYQLAGALSPSGSEAEWMAAIERVAPFPSAMIALYAAICAPLLVALPSAPNPIFGWCGETSTGKSTLLRLAASVFGDPDERGNGLVQKWNQTPAYLERISAFQNNLPICLDDTNDVPAGNKDMIPRTLYQFAGGKGKGRAKVVGTQRTESWRSSMLSTGEASLTSFSEDAGARSRTLVLSGPPFGTGSQEQLVSDVTVVCIEHHGHLGPKLIRALIDCRDQWPEMHVKYQVRCAEYAACADSFATKRLGKVIALLEMAKSLGEQCGLPAPAEDCDPIGHAWNVAVQCGSDTDRPLAAFRVVYRWGVAHRSEFWDVRMKGIGHTQPNRGWAGKWDHEDWDRISFVPQCLERVLKYHGFDPGAVLPLWHERGWTLTSEGRTTSRVRIAGAPVRVISLSREAVDEIEDS